MSLLYLFCISFEIYAKKHTNYITFNKKCRSAYNVLRLFLYFFRVFPHLRNIMNFILKMHLYKDSYLYIARLLVPLVAGFFAHLGAKRSLHLVRKALRVDRENGRFTRNPVYFSTDFTGGKRFFFEITRNCKKTARQLSRNGLVVCYG